MCYQCYENDGKPEIVTKNTKIAAALIAKVYEFSPIGGNAHIVIDDWNLDDEDIRLCIDDLLEKNVHEAGQVQRVVELACLDTLLALPKNSRVSAMALYYGFIDA